MKHEHCKYNNGLYVMRSKYQFKVAESSYNKAVLPLNKMH